MTRNGIPLIAEDTDQVVPLTSRKVYVALDERGQRIGESHQNAKLSNAEVDRMRDLREEEKWSYERLAALFQVPKATVQKICNYDRRATTIARWKVILLHSPISLTNQPKED